MNIGDIVYSDNGQRWRLVQDMGAGFWMAHATTATHIRGISPPLHIISEKHVTLSPQNAVIECTETIAATPITPEKAA